MNTTTTNNTTKSALIIGNGVTRKTFDIDRAKQKDVPIFGCNALYRDFNPDFLIAVDDEIIEEISKHASSDIAIIIPSEDERYEPKEYNQNRPRNNAGMIAMNEAIKRGHNMLYCVGMDFIIEDKELNTQNMYDDTSSYGPETRASYWDTIARLKYFEWFAQTHPEIHFRFLFPKNDYHFRSISSNNVSGQFFEKFYS